jgi:ATP-dependent DNA helicase 2 subunit 2
MPVAAQQAVKKPPEEEKKKEPSGPSRPNLPTPDRSPSPEVEAGRAHGRIIGSTYPLKDFMNNLKRGDLVSKAVEDMAVVIREIVMKPFATKRQEELIKCLKSMRDTCLKVCASRGIYDIFFIYLSLG